MAKVWVKGYTKDDGTKVKGHYRETDNPGSGIYQSTGKNPVFSTRGNGVFGGVTRSGWKPAKMSERSKNTILSALGKSDVQQVYRRKNKLFAFLMNGTEKELR